MDILLIDDDASLRRTIRMVLESANHQVVDVRTMAETMSQLESRAFDAALLDLRLAGESGLEILPEMLRVRPGLCVVIITAYAAVDTAVEAMRRGAFDYLPKPFTPGQLRILMERVAKVQRLEDRVRDLEAQIREVAPEADLFTQEPHMRQILDIAFKAAASEATILLRGESGTGKGVLARALHARSNRAAGPFVTVHCPSLSAELLESELFGQCDAYRRSPRYSWQVNAPGGTLSMRSATCRQPCNPSFASSSEVSNAWRDQNSGLRAGSWRPQIGPRIRCRRTLSRRSLLIQRLRDHAAGARGAPISCPWLNTCWRILPGKTIVALTFHRKRVQRSAI